MVAVNRETILIVFGFFVAALAILSLYETGKEALDQESLFKNYLARDLALLIDAVYAAPGDVEYLYTMDPRHTFHVNAVEGEVQVSSKSDFEREDEIFSYRFAYDNSLDEDKIDFEFKNDLPSTLPTTEELNIKPIQIHISKRPAQTGSTVKVEMLR